MRELFPAWCQGLCYGRSVGFWSVWEWTQNNEDIGRGNARGAKLPIWRGKKKPEKKFISEEAQYGAGRNKYSVLQHFAVQYQRGQMPLGRRGSQGQGSDHRVCRAAGSAQAASLRRWSCAKRLPPDNSCAAFYYFPRKVDFCASLRHAVYHDLHGCRDPQ